MRTAAATSGNFTITTPAETVLIGPDGKGEMVFTVTNTSGIPNRALGKIVPLSDPNVTWLSLPGEKEREFSVGAVQQFRVVADVPKGTAAGRYTWRLDVISALKSGEAAAAGPVVAFEVPPAATEKKQIPNWVWIALVVAAVVLGVVAYLLLRGPTMVQVPPVVGETRADAEAAIKAAGLEPKAVAPTEGRIGKVGTVVAQNPKATTEVEAESIVTIEVVPKPRRPRPLPLPGRPQRGVDTRSQ